MDELTPELFMAEYVACLMHCDWSVCDGEFTPEQYFRIDFHEQMDVWMRAWVERLGVADPKDESGFDDMVADYWEMLESELFNDVFPRLEDEYRDTVLDIRFQKCQRMEIEELSVAVAGDTIIIQGIPVWHDM